MEDAFESHQALIPKGMDGSNIKVSSLWSCLERLIFFLHRVLRFFLRGLGGSHMPRPIALNHDAHKGWHKGLKGTFETIPSLHFSMYLCSVMKPVRFRDLGRIDYGEAWDLQKELLQASIDRKTRNRDLPEEERVPTEDHLLFCEHPPVYTLGKSGSRDHVLISDAEMEERGIAYYHIDRGGDITHHGPGQLVVYPVLDLEHYFTDIGRYLRTLEEIVIRTLEEYGVEGERKEDATGVWLDVSDPGKARKICAMGVKCSRWVTMHGIALNVNNDLSFFEHIVPCGIPDKGVTSLQKELGREVAMEELKARIKEHFAEQFGMSFVPA